MNTLRRESLGAILSAVLLVSSRAAMQTDNPVRLDNSDWWSGLRSPDSGEETKPQQRELANANFRVLGVTLGGTMFTRAATKLGKAPMIERGDASAGRHQACYSSPDAQEKVHLIFEQGELAYSFYLFVGGPTWEGADRCVTSSAISASLTTGSGLRLGMTPAQVIALLGKPTRQRENELLYSFLVTKKTAPKDLKGAREQNPGTSEEALQANYGSYDLGTTVVAKFNNAKLAYLAISRVETY